MNNDIFLHVEDNKAVGKNGVFAMCYEVELSEKYSLGEEDFEVINDSWVKALKDLPKNSILVKQDIFQRQNFDTSDYKGESFLQKSTKEYFRGREYLSHKCFLFFVLPDGDTFNTKISNPFKNLNRKKFEKFDENIEIFTTSVEQSINFINGIKINSGKAFKIRKFSEKEVIGYYDFYFNNFQNDYVTDRILRKGHLQIGDKFIGAVCTRDEDSFPEKLSSVITDKDFSSAKYKFFQNYGEMFGISLDFDHVYNQIIFFEDNQEQLTKLRTRNDLLKKSSNFDPNNKSNAEKTGLLIKEIADNIDGDRIVKAHLNVFYSADNENDLRTKKNQIVDRFKELDIKTRQPIDNYLNSIFHNSFFLFANNFADRQLFYGNLNLATLFFNDTTNYKNDEKGVILNSRISNLPVVVDTWDEEKKYIRARNFMIFAPTGFGKSFTANHLFRQYYDEGARIVIVDLGQSYKKLSALYPNDTVFVHYQEGKPIGLNPFDLQGEPLTSSKIEDLSEFVLTHYKRGEVTTESEKTALKKIIEAYFKRGGEQSLLKFINAVREGKSTMLKELEIKDDYFDIDKFLFLMSEFEKGGIYEFLYKDESNDNLEKVRDKKIIIFELDEVKENELLLSIMLQLVATTINETVWKDKSTRGYIFFDEVAKQFKFKGILEKIEYFFQAVRKQNGAIGIVLQAISQLPETGEKGQIANTIIENTQVLYVLNAKDYRALQERFKMSEHAYNQMVSISSNFEGNRKYSEIFLMRGNHHQVYRLEVPIEVFWAYQTEGKQNDELMKVYEEVGDMELAIKKYINN